jgi:hypothetical protein
MQLRAETRTQELKKSDFFFKKYQPGKKLQNFLGSFATLTPQTKSNV